MHILVLYVIPARWASPFVPIPYIIPERRMCPISNAGRSFDSERRIFFRSHSYLLLFGLPPKPWRHT